MLALVPGLVALHAAPALAQRAAGPARIGWVSYVGQPDVGVEKLRLTVPQSILVRADRVIE